MFSNRKITTSIGNCSDKVERLARNLREADAIVIGAGAGLSTSAGFTYTGERFQQYFQDFGTKYGFKDMYSGGFYPCETQEEHWAHWSRYIYINRYMTAPKPVYEKLYELVHDKDYFVLTTNVDHCFQKAGFDKHRLFYTQGDYGLFQCSEPCHQETYDNENVILELGVGMNTPGIIKYPFRQMVAENLDAVYVCISYGEAYAPDEIKKKSICINGNIWEVLDGIFMFCYIMDGMQSRLRRGIPQSGG